MATKKGKHGRGPALCIHALCLRRVRGGARLCAVHQAEQRQQLGASTNNGQRQHGGNGKQYPARNSGQCSTQAAPS
jgi:hypothetical protein